MKLVSNEIILCHICGGSGTITNLERVNMYESEYVTKKYAITVMENVLLIK